MTNLEVESIPLSLYYDINDLNNHHKLLNSPKMLSCIHMNTRSLMHKLDLITNVIEQLDFHPTFVAISETWLSSYDRSLVNIEG